MEKYWFEDLTGEQSWTCLWYDYIICGQCGGIRKAEGRCPVCNCKMPGHQSIKLKDKYGQEFEIPMNTMMGAEGRYEDYVYLNMLEQEWRRPVSKYDAMPFMSQDKKPAAKAIIVLVFWTYFETRIERLLASAMRNLPDSIRQNLFKRYQSISTRTNELYKVLFGKANSYFLDLENLGHENISKLLQRIQNRRNDFMHGKPEAIDDVLIEDIVKSLKEEHESWIKVFNLRALKA
ncbi:MAG TPA: hypothetical protein VMU83_16205 [Hanamia sp.]|nr:hypothetical protein [Bacteroidota bacterium]HUZ60315.1 hypothetical protein [Hanamia sp.]